MVANRIVKVEPSPPRRLLGVGLLLVVGFLLIVTGMASIQVTNPYSLIQIGVSLAVFWSAWRVYRATSSHIVLKGGCIISSDGTLIARVDKITRVDRSLFAFKPTNGLLLLLDEPMASAWQPGLWWRIGRRVGIGGCTPRSQAKQLAEVLEDRKAGD